MPKLSEALFKVKVDGAQYREGLKALVLESKVRMQELREATLKAGLAHGTLAKSADTAKKSLGNLGLGVIGNIARFTLYYQAVGALNAIVGGAVDELRDLDEQLRNIQSITLESDASIMELGKTFIGMTMSGDSAGQSAANLANAMYEVVQSGFEGADAIHLVELAAKGASAGMTTTMDAADGLMTILLSYKMPVTEAANVMDELFTIVNLGRIKFEELNTNLGYLIPTAAALSIPLEEVGAAIEMLTRQGQMPSRVMTNLNQVLSNLLKPNKELGEAITKLGFSSGAAMVKQLGLVKSLELLHSAAADGRITREQLGKKTEELGEKSKQAGQKVDDLTEAVRQSKFNMDEAEKAFKDTAVGSEKRRQAQEKLTRATATYNKNLRELKDAQNGANKAGKDYNTGLSNTINLQSDAEATLAAWFGDVRAIRAVLPLTANELKDFNAMLFAHRREMALGNRMEKALEQQKKSFNYQVRQASSNLKALGAIILGPVLKALGGLLMKFNNLFTKLVDFNEVTKKVTFIWEKQPEILTRIKDILEKIAVVIGVQLAPSILGILKFIPNLLKFSNPWILAATAILLLLQHFGVLDDIVKFATKSAQTLFQWLGANVPKILKEISGEIQKFTHFLELGFSENGAMGGKHNFFEKLAFGIGRTIRDIIPKVKAFVGLIKDVVHMFTMGFSGGKVGGKSDLEMKIFAAGQAAREILDFVVGELIPGLASFFSGVVVHYFEILKGIFMAVKGMVNDILNSESFQTIVTEIFKAVIEIGKGIGALAKILYDFSQTAAGQFIIKLAGYFIAIAAAIMLLTGPIGGLLIAVTALYVIVNIIDFIVKAFNAVSGAISDAINWFNKFFAISVSINPSAIWGKFVEITKTVWDGIKSIVMGVLSELWDALTAYWTELGQAYLGLPALILQGAEGIYNAGRKLLENFFAGAADFIGGALNVGGKVASAITGMIKRTIIRPALQALDDAIPNKIPIPGAPDINLPDNPINDIVSYKSWAKGVRDWMGGLALMGEHGPEFAVLPSGSSVATAPKTSHIMDNLVKGGSNKGGNVDVNANFNINGETLEETRRKLHEEVDSLIRMMGGDARRRGGSLNTRVQLA